MRAESPLAWADTDSAAPVSVAGRKRETRSLSYHNQIGTSLIRAVARLARTETDVFWKDVKMSSVDSFEGEQQQEE